MNHALTTRLSTFRATPPALLALLAALWTVLPALAAAEPDPVPNRWELDLVVGPLRVMNVTTDEGIRPFFVLTYLVTNNSGEDLLFAPSWELATDAGDIIPAGRDVSRRVTRRILDRFDNPLLEDQLNILGRLLQGRENAKEGLVIWPATDLALDEVNVYAAGFSGEFKMYEVEQDDGSMERYVLRKTYALRYDVGGELSPSTSEQLSLRERPRWIMR